MNTSVFIINGPNLNMLGTREPEIYGRETLDEVVKKCDSLSKELGLSPVFVQSNAESALIDTIHTACTEAQAIIINPGAYSHTSIAILDALEVFNGPVIEVHISNIHHREAFRHHSYVSSRANGVIVGCGTNGYMLAIREVARLVAKKP